MTRHRHFAAGAFVVVFLTIQIVYPALAWFSVDISRFSWHMYAGQSENPEFAVIFDDGTRRDFIPMMRRASPVRVLGPAVDQERFVPPFLCRRWPGVREVRVRYSWGGQVEHVVPCPGVAP